MTVSQLLGGRYQFIKTLGSDLQGGTYLVADTFLDGHPKCVAKQLPLSGRTPKATRFILVLLKKKAEALKHVGTHDQVPKILAYFEEKKNFYLVEEFIPGRPLADVLKPGQRLSEPLVRQLLQEILKILLVVHSWGVIHRCIKPSNIIQRHPDGKLVLTGFGIFKEISTQNGRAPEGVTHSRINGTSVYIPPNQPEGQRYFSSDIYAVGMIGIQALTGLSQEELSDLKRSMSDSNHGIPESLSWHSYAQVSPGLRMILDRMVSLNADYRYKTAAEVLEDLERTTGEPGVSEQPMPVEPEHADVSPKKLQSLSGALTRPRQVGLVAVIALLSVVAGLWVVRLPQRAMAHYALHQGNKLEDQGETEAAIAKYTQAISAFPSPDAYLQRGIANAQINNWQQAQQDFTQAIDMGDPSSEAYYQRANMRFALGDRQGALEDYTEAIRLKPNNARAYVNRGSVRADLGDERGAVEDYDQAVQQDPNLAAAYLNRCLSRSNLEDHHGAIADCSQAIRLEPNSALAFQNRGLVRRRLGDPKGAIEDFNIAINLNPEDADPYYNRGLARAQLGDEVGAEADYTQAIQLDPSHALAYYDRGLTRFHTGDADGAIADLEQSATLCLNVGRTDCYEDAQYHIRQIQQGSTANF